MLQEIITELNDRLSALGYFKQLYGLCEQVQDIKVIDGTPTDRTYPATYTGKGNYKMINLENEIAYFRLNGAVTQSEDDEESEVGASNYITKTYPLRLVFSMKKSKVKPDDAYSEDRAAQTIINAIQANSLKEVSKALKTGLITVNVTEFETNKWSVHSEEYSGFDMDIKFDYIYSYIDLDIIISGSTDCFENYVC